MHIRVKNTLGLILALLIALTSSSMAVARGQMYDATGAIVLCTGAGPTSVLVDREGQPVEQAPLCPDGAFSFLGFLASSDEVPLLTPSEFPVFVKFEITNWPEQALGQTRVRGPPAV